MGFLVYVVFQHAYQYVSALVTGFFLVGPFLAIGLYALVAAPRAGRAGLARAHARRLGAEQERDRPLRAGARGDPAGVGARVAHRVRALLHAATCRRSHDFLGQVLSLDNLEFLVAYVCVGGFFAVLVFAISVVSVPMMLDRNTDGIVAVLTSLKAVVRERRRDDRLGRADRRARERRFRDVVRWASSSRCR